MRISAAVLLTIGTLVLSANAQTTNDSNNMINCVACVTKSKKWDSDKKNCVD